MLKQIKNMSFRAKLGMAFLLLSITPMALIAVIFHVSFVNNNEKQVADTLYSIALNKENTLNQHMLGLRQQALHYSNTDFVRYAMSRFYGFSYAFNLISDDAQRSAVLLKDTFNKQGDFKDLPSKLGMTVGSYAHVHDRFHEGFEEYLAVSDFIDIILIDLKGQVVYSTRKAGYFTANLGDQGHRNSPLGKAFSKLDERLAKESDVTTTKPVVFQDYSLDPVNQEIVSYLLIPINNHGRITGYIAYVLPTSPLNKIMASRQGLGETGETYTVNEAGYPISDLLSQDPALNLMAIYQSETPMWLEVLHQAKRSATGTLATHNYEGKPTLAAFTNLNLMGYDWVIIAEQANSEIQATSVRFRNLIVFIGCISIAIIIAIVYVLSRSLTRPLNSLMRATEAVTQGEWDRHILGRGRTDEIGRLASRFDEMQQAIANQINVINDTNLQLEEKVAVINEQNIALIQADKIKDEFLTNTSHELRTPLTGVIGITESVLNGVAGPCSEQQHQQLTLALNGARRLAHLVDDLLDFHKVKNNRLRVNMTAVQVNATVNGVLALSQHLVSGKPLKLLGRLPEDILFVEADPIRLEQVLFNLVTNAIKYTDEGAITVSVRRQQQQVIISVEDTGMGIAKQDQSQIFEPFKQVDGSLTRTQGGSGLGLAISKQLIELMQGKLWLNSEIDKGSCFSFSLSYCDPVMPMAATSVVYNANLMVNSEQTTLEQDDEFTQPGKRILVVDDEWMNLQVLKNHLSFAGYECKLLSDGQQAIDFIQQQEVDLVILDVMLPHISGFTVASEIRKSRDMASLPILMLTAKTRVKDIMTGFHSGANDYLMKPFMQDELLARVHNLLEVKQASQFSQENKMLKREVARRIETEQALQTSQARMTQMLETVEDAILSVNPFNQIVFFNQAAQRLLGYSANQMIGSDIGALISQTDLEAIAKGVKKHMRFEVQLDIASANNKKIRSQAFISRVMSNKEADLGDISIVLHQTQNAQLQPTIQQGDEQLAELEYRSTLVQIMNHSLALWQDCTAKSKVNLAEESRIWSVYLDRSSAQTRTLDKYLLLQTLPKQPRWRDVLRTATFVMHHCENKTNGPEVAEISLLCQKVKQYLADK